MNATRGTSSRGRGAGAYARVGVESGVMSASPHQLITMLFDGVAAALGTARLHMRKGNASVKGESVSKAPDIINNGLLAALDRERGGELSERLGWLYQYISRQLLVANLHNDEARLDEAARLLDDIGSAWRQIDPRSQGAVHD